MLRLLAILAGLVLIALLVLLPLRRGTQVNPPAPEPATAVGGALPAHMELSASDLHGRDEAGEPLAADARYVGIVGELKREEEGTLVDGGVVTFCYRYLSKGPEAELRKVPVDVDEHGHFEQLFSEPVQLSSCLIEPVEVEGLDLPLESMRRADFLHVERPLDVHVGTRGICVPLQVPAGLEIAGRVIDAQTNEPIAHALVWAQIELERTIASFTKSDGSFHMLGIPSTLSAPGRDYVDVGGKYDMIRYLKDLVVHARAERHGVAEVVVPLPLSVRPFTFVEIPMPHGFRVKGRVLDSQGKPLSGAGVTLCTPAEEQTQDIRDAHYPRCQTDVHGDFAFDGVQPPDGAELRARHPWQKGPSAMIAIGSLREDRMGLELQLPESQVYRIELRDPKGDNMNASDCSVRIRNSSGEYGLDGLTGGNALRIYLPIGERSDLLVSYDSGGTFRPVVLHGKTTLEPLLKREEPETVILDLEL